jgi:hypothetical protein
MFFALSYIIPLHIGTHFLCIPVFWRTLSQSEAAPGHLGSQKKIEPMSRSNDGYFPAAPAMAKRVV